MRRLWAFILLAVTSLAVVGVSFSSIFANVSSSIQYSEGREITFKVSDKDNSDAELEEGAVEEIADEMIRRLEVAKVNEYELQIQGEDTIKLILSEETDTAYSMISTYVSFNGSLALSNYNTYILPDAFLVDGEDAFIDDVNSYPAIVLPVNTSSSEFTQLIEEARKALTDENTEYGESSTDDDGNTTTSYYLYLWYDFDEEVCSFDALNSEDSMIKSEAQEHLLMKFRVEDCDDEQYFPDDENDKIYSLLNIDSDSDGVASVKEKENAYTNANFYVNLINAGELNYKVTNIFEETVIASATLETLVEGDGILFSRTLKATLVAILFVFLITLLFYQTGAVAILTNTILSVFAGACSVVLVSAEFSVFGVVGLIAVAVASLASGMVYCSKLKSESYKGRTLKKANAEAARKSMLPIVDINVALIIIGVFSYVFSSSTMRTFAAITVIGGLVSLVLNLLLLRGMMWLATNATCMMGKYEKFGIDASKVPNLIEGEKQTYFGNYADKDLTKNKKPVGVIASVLFILSLAGMITFSSLNGGRIFNDSSAVDATEIYFETTSANSALSEKYIKETILANTIVYEEDEKPTDAKALSEYVEEVTNPAGYCEIVENEDIDHYFYVVTLNTNITEDWNAEFTCADKDLTIEAEKVNDVLSKALTDLGVDGKASVSLKSTVVYKNNGDNVKTGPIVLGTGVALAVMCVYLILRYRLSRGLTTLVTSVGTTAIALGVISCVRVAASSMSLAATPLIALFALITSIIVMNVERENVIDSKSKDLSVEERKDIAVKSLSESYTIIVDLLMCGLWIALCFFGFGPKNTGFSWLFALVLLGFLVAWVMAKVLFVPIAQLFYKWFKPATVHKTKKNKNTTKAKVNKSAEPEEAVFIGIND